MTKIEDMSEPERQSWITLLADGTVLIYFWQTMTQGFGFTPQHFEPAEIGAIFTALVVITIILHASIAAVFDMRKNKEAFEKDERDLAIAAKGNRNAYMALQFGVGAIIVIRLLHYVIGDTYAPSIALDTPVALLFALVVVSYASDLIKHGTQILSYRAE